MSPEAKEAGLAAALAHKLREDLRAAEAQVTIVEAELQRQGEPPLAAMALMSVCIDRAYSALEAGFLRIARDLDGIVPSGDDWYRALLHQMTLPIQDRRPELLRSATASGLDPLRRHRHWLRHAYAASFEWPKLAGVARALPGVVAAARADLDRFIAFLQPPA